jgi:hypothetical protein
MGGCWGSPDKSALILIDDDPPDVVQACFLFHLSEIEGSCLSAIGSESERRCNLAGKARVG